MLTVQALCASLGPAFKLRDLSFRVRAGELLAVLGPNGSGKSSLLRLILGLQAPESGTISWSDQLLSSGARILVPPEHRGMGVLFQEGVLFPHLSVMDNVALGFRGPGPGHKQVEQALRAMRIDGLAHQAVPRLSGGEQQRVALARALVQQPRLMLLDEPFHSLDATVKQPIMAELRTLIKDQAMAAVFVTHDLDEAASLSDRVVLLRDGSKLQEGTMQELYRHPASPWVARFLGEVESLDLRHARAWGVELAGSQHGERVWFRREDMVIEPSQSAAHQGAEIIEVRRSGPFLDARLRWPDGSSSVSRVCGGHDFAVGQRVRARLVAALPSQLEGEAVP